MQLTRAADYALRVMIHLAGLSPDARVSRDELAKWGEVPAQYLGKVLQALSRAELIISRRGAQGGFSLSRPADQVNALDVVQAIEGPLQLNICLAEDERCHRRSWCSGHTLWQEAQEALAQVLRRATLARLSAEALAKQRVMEQASQQQEVPLWNSLG